MSLFDYLIELSMFFFLSFSVLYCMRKVGYAVGLVDKPNARKHHEGVVPLVGGLSLCITVLYFLYVNAAEFKRVEVAAACLTVLVLIGVADDRFDISFKLRMGVQAILALIIMNYTGLTLSHVGNVFGLGVLDFPVVLDSIITVIAVIGAINAFNMVDGIDGLLGGLASVTFTALGTVFFMSGNEYLGTICLLIVTALVPYIMLNLGFPLGRRFKIFMGDAGSMFIGFSVVWMLIRGTQEPEVIAFKPVTALWVIAIPLMDMATIMIRRMRKGHSPFKPDREHLHHICQRIGLSPLMTLFVICLMASICAFVGIWTDLHGVNESVMFVAFLVMFAVYFMAISYIWRITTFIKKLFGRNTNTQEAHQ